MERMTIHRGLSELKLIDSKIKKRIEDIDPLGVYQKDKKVNGVYDKDDFASINNIYEELKNKRDERGII